MNKVILIGRLARDPELRTTPTNLSVATFSLAVSRPFRPEGGGQPETDFINCVVWRRQAENLARYCQKGSQIAIEGRIQSRSYTANDGSKRYVTEVMCDNITFLGSKADNSNNSGNSFNNYGAANNGFGQDTSYPMPAEPSNPANVPTTDISQDPFKDFGEEITLSDDDLPF